MEGLDVQGDMHKGGGGGVHMARETGRQRRKRSIAARLDTLSYRIHQCRVRHMLHDPNREVFGAPMLTLTKNVDKEISG